MVGDFHALSHLILTTALWVRCYVLSLVLRERTCLSEEHPASLYPVTNISPFKVGKSWGSKVQYTEVLTMMFCMLENC